MRRFPRVAAAVLVFSVCSLGGGCPRTSLIGAPCADPDDKLEVCEARSLLRCNGQVYELAAPCVATCPAPDDIEPLIAHEQETITTDTTWACEDGAHVVTGVVNVGPGATLTIEPGTSVRVDPSSRIDVDIDGRFVVDASAFAPVVMTSNNGQSAGFGSATSGGVNVFAAEGEPSILRHFIVERGIQGLGVLGLSSTTTPPVIQNSTFRDNENFGIKVGCDEEDFVVPDFEAACTGEGDAPCGNNFFENGAGKVSACN
jgi:hypothetical protein